VNVRWCTVDAVEVDAFGFMTSLLQDLVDLRLNAWNQQRIVVLGVPGDVQVNLVKDVAGHGGMISWCSCLKANCRKAGSSRLYAINTLIVIPVVLLPPPEGGG
jgi:hypothetical protein